LAVSLDSVGYEEYYRTLFEAIGLDYDENTMHLHHSRLDTRKITKKAYDTLPAVRRRRASGRAVRIRENIKKVLQDKKKGKSYGSGINDPSQAEEKCKPKKQSKSICPFCGKIGHSRQRHRDCTFTTYVAKAKKGRLSHVNVAFVKYEKLARQISPY
jgi:hypothetical protein